MERGPIQKPSRSPRHDTSYREHEFQTKSASRIKTKSHTARIWTRKKSHGTPMHIAANRIQQFHVIASPKIRRSACLSVSHAHFFLTNSPCLTHKHRAHACHMFSFSCFIRLFLLFPDGYFETMSPTLTSAPSLPNCSRSRTWVTGSLAIDELKSSSRSEMPVRTVSQRCSHLQWRILFKELWSRPTTTADYLHLTSSPHQ